ncbi:heavy-metal-associated domain-containing protein [Thalassospira povalilytica]|uniref:Heavy metal transporter n=1 Tax=Thalassospira povalilytica TaxID=732237 RepID=A0A8I1M869_9PROT|nr:cation transporter [Thalassospira povalilytica]MBN8197135.1 heavy-metal-associated domain-containing protein [Thalassospira povalilytica]PKR51059.1 heavy metal transporter [Thalassospira povalilytica]
MVKLKVEKMSCGHCANAVTAAATKVSGVESAEVDLESGEIAVSGTADVNALIAAITDAGYPASVTS